MASEWIKASERMPEMGAWVVVPQRWRNERCFRVCQFMLREGEEKWVTDGGTLRETPMFWRPIPPVPEEKHDDTRD